MNKRLNKIFEKWNVEQIIGVLFIIFFVIMLIPILYISQYNHPCSDDYGYGQLTHATWIHTGSFIETIKSAFMQVKNTYNGWQGTFFAVFLMALQPAVFNEKLYFIVPIILLGALITSTFFFMKVVLKNYLKATNSRFLMISIIILILSIQFVPSAVQGFYWFNGAVFYTFFHSMMLFLIGIMLLYAQEKSPRKNIIYILLSAVLSIFIGGGNYVTALLTVIIQVSIGCVLFFINKKKSLITLIPILCTTCSFFISIIAPGNAVRQVFFPENYSAASAIIHSFRYAFIQGKNWTTLWVVFSIILILPIIWKTVYKTEFTFKYPLLVIGYSFCIFAAMYTPTLYAMGDDGAQRVWDIRYYTYLLLIFFNVIYCTGWIRKKRIKQIDFMLNVRNKAGRPLIYGYLVVNIVLLIATCSVLGLKENTAYYALMSIKTGEAKKYDKILDERLTKYKDKSLKDVTVKRLSVKPKLLYFDDITKDPTDGRNISLAVYYEKNSIYISNKK